MTGLGFPLWTLVLAVIWVRGEELACNPEHHCYESTERGVVMSPGFPGPYPPRSHHTWEWRHDSGLWGVVFTHYNVTTIGCKDYVTINDTQRSQVYCAQSNPPEFYSRTSTLFIEFVASNESKPGNFKLTILYGRDLDELRTNIYYEKHEKKKDKGDDDLSHKLHVSIVIIASVVAFIVLLVIVCGLLLYRKHVLERRRDHMASLGIRRGSGRHYSRKSSSNAEDAPRHEPAEPTCTIIMGNGARPWTVRAVMTSASAPAACAGQSTLPKSVNLETSHAHSSSHAHSASQSNSTSHTHFISQSNSTSHAHSTSLTSTSGATPMTDSVTIHVSARVGDRGEDHSYTPLPTLDSDGEWLDERQPILED